MKIHIHAGNTFHGHHYQYSSLMKSEGPSLAPPRICRWSVVISVTHLWFLDHKCGLLYSYFQQNMFYRICCTALMISFIDNLIWVFWFCDFCIWRRICLSKDILSFFFWQQNMIFPFHCMTSLVIMSSQKPVTDINISREMTKKKSQNKVK